MIPTAWPDEGETGFQIDTDSLRKLFLAEKGARSGNVNKQVDMMNRVIILKYFPGQPKLRFASFPRRGRIRLFHAAEFWQSRGVNHLKIESGCLLGRAVRRRSVAGLHLTEAVYSGKENFPKHAYERPFLYLVLQGGYDEHYGRRTIGVEPRSVVYQPADTPHSNTFHATEVRCFHVEFTAAWDDRLSGLPAPLTDPEFWRGGEPAWLAERLFREWRNPDEVSALAVEGLALELLVAVTRTRTKTNAKSASRWVNEARDWIQANFAESFSHEHVARRVGVHPVRLARAFRRRFGYGIGECLRRCRVEHARRLLARTETPLAEIALECGFYDQAHFTRTFRRYTGVTPAAFRATTRNGQSGAKHPNHTRLAGGEW